MDARAMPAPSGGSPPAERRKVRFLALGVVVSFVAIAFIARQTVLQDRFSGHEELEYVLIPAVNGSSYTVDLPILLSNGTSALINDELAVTSGFANFTVLETLQGRIWHVQAIGPVRISGTIDSETSDPSQGRHVDSGSRLTWSSVTISNRTVEPVVNARGTSSDGASKVNVTISLSTGSDVELAPGRGGGCSTSIRLQADIVLDGVWHPLTADANDGTRCWDR